MGQFVYELYEVTVYFTVKNLVQEKLRQFFWKQLEILILDEWFDDDIKELLLNTF